MDKIEPNTIKFDSFDTYDDSVPISNWYKKKGDNQSSLRVVNSDYTLPGVLRFNTELSIFQGYSGDLSTSNDGWTNFQTFNGLDGKDGNNAISEITGTNLKLINDTEVYGLFKEVKKTEEKVTVETKTIRVNNLINNIYSNPVYEYNNFGYNSDTGFDLSEKNITFIPNDLNYKVLVRRNDVYPRVNYKSHHTVRNDFNSKTKISKDNYYNYLIGTGNNFKFYNKFYNNIYIHENGYLTLDKGNTSLIQNRYTNHFNNLRISFLMGNLENTAVDTLEGGNRPDIFIGRGNYNELVITYNNISSRKIESDYSITTNNYSNVQVRLWLSDCIQTTKYPQGTIQFIYGKCDFLKPLVGLSDKSIYNELVFTPLRYDTLLDDDGFYETNGAGVPKLKAEMIFKVLDDKTKTTLDSFSNVETNKSNNIDIKTTPNGSFVLCETITDTDRTYYSEQINNKIYYTRIYNLGDIIIDSFILCINSLLDGENIFSDTASKYKTNLIKDFTNNDFKNNTTTLQTESYSNNNYISLTNIYKSHTGDYITVYNYSNDKNITGTNSFIDSIAFSYCDFNVKQDNTTFTTYEKLYKNFTNKTLLLKIVYCLKSDTDNPNTHSFQTTSKINKDTNDNLIALDPGNFTFTTSNSTSVPPFNYILNNNTSIENNDFFKFKLNTNKGTNISLKDYKNNSNRIIPLKITIYKESNVDNIISRELFAESTIIDSKYPQVSIPNSTNEGVKGQDIIYYLIVSGDIKFYYYTIKFASKTVTNTDYHILQFPLIKNNGDIENLNDMSKDNQISLITKIKEALVDKVINSSGDKSKSSHIYEVVLTGPNLLVNIYIDKTFTSENGDIDIFKENIKNIQFTYNIGSSTNLTNKKPLTIISGKVSEDSLPEKEIDLIAEEEEEDSSGSSTNTTSNILKHNTFQGLIHKQETGVSPNIFRGINIKKMDENNVITTYFCYLTVVKGDNNSRTVKVNVEGFQNNTSINKNNDIITFTSTDITKLPYSIHQVSGSNLEFIILYGIEDSGGKKIKIEKWKILEPGGGIINLEKPVLQESGTTKEIIISHIDPFIFNTGVIDIYNNGTTDIYNFFYLDIINSVILIKKIDENNVITTYLNGIIEYKLENKIQEIDLKITNNYINFLYRKTNTDENYKLNVYGKQSEPESINNNNMLIKITSGDGSFGLLKDDNKVILLGRVGEEDNKTITHSSLENVKSLFSNKTISNYTYMMQNNIYVFIKNDNTVGIYPNQTLESKITDSNANVKNIFHNNDIFIAHNNDNSITLIDGNGYSTSYTISTLDGNTEITHIIPGGLGFVIVKNNSGPIKYLGKMDSFNEYEDEDIVKDFSSVSSLLTSSNPVTQSNISSNILTNDKAFVVLRDDGVLVCWGAEIYGGTEPDLFNETPLKIYKNNIGFALITRTRKLISWGKPILNINAENNKDFKEVYSTSKAFAGLRNDGTVEVWGDPAATYNIGHIKKFQNPINFENVFLDDVINNITEIYSNKYSFVGKKVVNGTVTLITWGDSYMGGSPYKESEDSSSWTPLNLSSNGKEIKDIGEYRKIVSTDGAYAILKNDGNILTWGSNYYGGNCPDSLTFSGNVVELHSNSHSFIALLTNGDVISWGNDIYGGNSSNITDSMLNYNNPKYNIVKNTDNEIIKNQLIVNRTNNINSNEQKNSIISNTNNYIYLYKDSSALYVKRQVINGALFEYTLANIGTTYYILEFELTNDKYLKIVYTKDTNGSGQKLMFLIDIESETDAFINPDIPFTNSIVKKSVSNYNLYLVVYKENKYIFTTYSVNSFSNIIGEVELADISTIIPNNDSLFIKIYPIDYINDKLRFYFLTHNTDDDNNNFTYSIYLFREDTNQKNIVFNNNIQEDLTIERIPDKLELDDTIIEENIQFIRNKNINNINYNIVIYKNNTHLILQIFNNNSFYEEEFYEFTNNTEFITLEIVNSNLYLFINENNKLKIIVYNLLEDLINLNLDNSILNINFDSISNIYINDNNIYLVLLTSNLKLYKITNNIILLKEIEKIDNITDINIIKNNNIINISFNINNYYEYNINTDLIELKHRNDLILFSVYNKNIYIKLDKFLEINNDLYYITYEENTFNILLKKGNLVLYSLEKYNSLEYLKNRFVIYNYFYYNDNIYLVYSSGNGLKTILKYNINSGNIILKSYKFNFLKIINNNILLFDIRNIYSTITIRYLNLELEEKILNRFTNIDYLGKKLYYLKDENNNIYFISVLENENKIYKYLDISNGEYITIKNNLETEIIEKKIVNDKNQTINLFRSSERTQIYMKDTYFIDIVKTNNNDVFIFKEKETEDISYVENKNFLLGTGSYIIKNVSKRPFAILTNNNDYIKYRGLSYNNLDKEGNNLIKKKTVGGKQYSYYYYYGDIEIIVTGDFGEVAYEYFGQTVTDNNRLEYSSVADISSINTPIKNKDRLFLKTIENKQKHFLYNTGNKNDSVPIIGQKINETYSSLDGGDTYYNYNVVNYNKIDCLYIGTNSIPNYIPTYGDNEIKGNWKNNTNNEDDNYYAIGLTNHGYIDKNINMIGTEIKIPLEPTMANEKIYNINNVNIREKFWHEGDLYWKTLMEDTNYNTVGNMLTPMGPIGICVNGVSLYNYTTMTNEIKEVYNSDNSVSDSLSINKILTDGSAYQIKNAYTENEYILNKTNKDNEIADNQTGYVDLNNRYHYHTYPITLEGQLIFGNLTNSNSSSLLENDNIIDTIKLYIGHTYYFNTSHSSNLNDLLKFKKENTDYTFDNNIIYNGIPGEGYSVSKFTIPKTDLETELKIYSKTNSDITEKTLTKLDYKLEIYNIEVDSLGLFKITKGNNIYNNQMLVNDNSIKLFFELNVKYEFKYETTKFDIDKYNLGLKDYNDNYITISLDKDNNTFTFKIDNKETLFIVNDKTEQSISDISNERYLNIIIAEPESINYYVKINNDNYEIYESRLLTSQFDSSFKYNGCLEYHDAYDYLEHRKAIDAHSPLLGYSYDGYPIYGPLGYKSDDTDIKSGEAIKYLKSSYTGTVDSNGNPTYVQGSGDLDICNGLNRKTPEFPNGIYHYIFTIGTETKNTKLIPKTITDFTYRKYGFRNEYKKNLKLLELSFPYSIGAFRGIPNKYNFKFINDNKSTTTTLENKTKFDINLKSLKSIKNNFIGKRVNSVNISQDDNYVFLKNNNLPYIWNFTNTQEDKMFSSDNVSYKNNITELKSDLSSEILKAYGTVNKYISNGSIQKGTAVRFVVNDNNELCVETYISVLSEGSTGASFLGIALNQTTNSGDSVYICTNGITTIKLGGDSNINIKCGSYGVLAFSSSNGEIISLGESFDISNNIAVAGYFLENKENVIIGSNILFNVQSNYEFN